MNVELTKAEGQLRCAFAGMVLGFDETTGAWTHLSHSGKDILDGGNGLAPLTLMTGGISTLTRTQYHIANVRDSIPVGHDFKLVSYKASDGENPVLTLVIANEQWRIEETFLYNKKHGRLERRFGIENHTGDEVILRDVIARMPAVSDEQRCTLEVPGFPDILHQACAKLPYGHFDLLKVSPENQEPGWRPGFLAAVMPDVHMSSWSYGEELPTFWQVYRGDCGVWFEQVWQCPMRLKNGERLDIGVQYVKIGEENFSDSLSFMWDFWDEVGVSLKQPTRQWAKEAFIYEVVVGEKRFHNSGHVYSPYPTVDDLIADLPRIHDLGFDVIEIMPHFPFPNYSVHDYFDIDVHYGPKVSMKKLVNDAHALGMRIFLDVVMHGVADKTSNANAIHERNPLLDEHPEFFIYTEDGRVAMTYTYSFDQANPQFRKYMQDVFCYYIKELDVDGFRVDAIHWNFFPNWQKNLPYPAYKTLGSCFGMFAGVRDAVMEIKPDVAFYTETTGPVMANSYDLFYNYDEVWMYESLLPVIMRGLPLTSMSHRADVPAIDAKGAAEWLDLRKKVLPRDLVKVHHADSHDSHEWMWIGIFRREYFGLAQTRALFAYCCFVEGAVMNYVGGEKGSEEEYKALIRLRKSNKALLSGECDYLAITGDNPRLFTPLRRYGEEIVLPVINFSTEEANSTLDLSRVKLTPDARYRFTELLTGVQITGTGTQFARFDVKLPPYGYQAWEIIAL